jgi:protein-tyrosine phosphatase
LGDNEGVTKRVLVVCSGNICRSPMAEGILRHLAAEAGMPLELRGAGTLKIVGRPPSAEAVEACREKGVDISGLRSAALDEERLEWADQVLCMAQHHVESCLALAPSADVVRLGQWSTVLPGEDIADPVGQPLPAFRTTYKILDDACRAWIEAHRS